MKKGIPTTEPTADMFRQTSPCADCPFLKEGGVRHGGPRALAYAGYFTNGVGATFPCHNSVPKDDNREKWSSWRTGQTLCTGGLLFAEKLGVKNGIMRYGAAMGWYHPGKLEGMALVFDSLAEMLNTHILEEI